MSDVLRVIRERRSVRNFENRGIPEEDIKKILEAVQWTPSWANTQCWEVVLIKEESQKKKLQATVSPGNPATRAVVEAPVVLALCAKMERAGYYKGAVTTKFGDWFMFDLGLATQSICLMAQSLGLGTVIVGLFDHNKAKEVIKTPAGMELVVLIPLGYPVSIPPAPKRRSPEEFTHQETF